jgi:hypothetical protein
LFSLTPISAVSFLRERNKKRKKNKRNREERKKGFKESEMRWIERGKESKVGGGSRGSRWFVVVVGCEGRKGMVVVGCENEGGWS